MSGAAAKMYTYITVCYLYTTYMNGMKSLQLLAANPYSHQAEYYSLTLK